MFRRLYVAFAAAASMFFAASPVQAGLLKINNVGTTITDSNVLGAINTAIGNVESLYSTGNVAGDVTLNVDFTYSAASTSTNLASSYQQFYGYSYSDYTSALRADLKANSNNTNLATAVANLSSGNIGPMAVTYGQALLLSQYGLSTPGFAFNDSININSDWGSTWNFNGTTTSAQYDAIGAIEHELDELLGIGGGGSALGRCSNSNFFCTYYYGATDLYRYSGAGVPSNATSGTYLSINGGSTKIVGFNSSSGGDYGDFTPPCGPTQSNSGNDQYIQNAFNCKGSDEIYSTSSPEYLATTAIGWDPVPEPGTLWLFGFGLVGLAWVRRRAAA